MISVRSAFVCIALLAAAAFTAAPPDGAEASKILTREEVAQSVSAQTFQCNTCGIKWTGSKGSRCPLCGGKGR